MTTKLTTAITAAALAAFAVFAETNAPSEKSDETAALKARIEKLEKDLATLRAQFIGIEPIVTNGAGEMAWLYLGSLVYGNLGYRQSRPMFEKFRKSEAEKSGRMAVINAERKMHDEWKARSEAARTNLTNRVTLSPRSHSSAESVAPRR